MSAYFEAAESMSSIQEIPKFLNLHEAIELPVAPSRSEWELLEGPTRLSRLFEFESKKQLAFFLDQLLEYEDTTGHSGKISIEGTIIMIEIYTHDVNNVTELDIEYAKTADEIYIDALNAYE